MAINLLFKQVLSFLWTINIAGNPNLTSIAYAFPVRPCRFYPGLVAPCELSERQHHATGDIA